MKTRAEMRRIVADSAALVDLLEELYSRDAIPQRARTEREIGAGLAEQRLIARLKQLRDEAEEA